jgi:hypothetical protein
MLKKKEKRGYSSHRIYIQGRGFIDTVSNVFTSMKPTLQNIGSYVSQNKDLIAKPLLGAAGDLAAFGLTQGGKALLTKMINKAKDKKSVDNLDSKGLEILQSMLDSNVSNIIGSGIKRF